MKLNTPELTSDPAGQVIDILEEEANQLTKVLDPNAQNLPHRAVIAILREIERLRKLARYVEFNCSSTKPKL